jgi:hypothetical protein
MAPPAPALGRPPARPSATQMPRVLPIQWQVVLRVVQKIFRSGPLTVGPSERPWGPRGVVHSTGFVSVEGAVELDRSWFVLSIYHVATTDDWSSAIHRFIATRCGGLHGLTMCTRKKRRAFTRKPFPIP